MRRLAPAATAVLLACLASHGRAEDPPAADAPKPAPMWGIDGAGYEIHASPDGKWIGCRESSAVRLYPTDGGTPVLLDCGKDERLGSAFGFSADSKFVCVAGDASPAVVKGLPEDKTQSVFFFPIANPAKRRKVNLVLKSEGISGDVKKHLDPSLRSMKLLSGEVREFTPFVGTRVIFDRGELGLTLWDLATEAKFAAPPALDSTLSCGLNADASRCVRTTGKAIEVRDVKTNRVLQTVPTPDYAKSGVIANYPALTRDGACVLVLRCKFDPKELFSRDSLSEYYLDCWSLADSKRLWETFVGTGKYCRGPYVGAAHAAAHLDDRAVVVSLADGKNANVDFESKKVTELCPSADGKSLWAVLDLSSLTRVDFPAAEAPK